MLHHASLPVADIDRAVSLYDAALAALGYRRVCSGRLHSAQPFLTNALRDQYIGLEEVADGIWNVVYYSTLLGKIDERTLLITGV